MNALNISFLSANGANALMKYESKASVEKKEIDLRDYRSAAVVHGIK